MEFYFFIFLDCFKKLDGCLVEIIGYVILVVEDGLEVVLLVNFYVVCFFCGKVSLVLVMSVLFIKL